MRDLLRTWKYFREDTPRVAASIGLLLFSTALNILKPWPLAIIVDSVLGPKPLPVWLRAGQGLGKPAILAGLCATLLLLYLMQAGLSAGQNYLSIQTGLRGLARVRNELFSWLQRLSLRYHQGARAGDLVYRASWDTYSVQTLFQQGLMTLLSAVVSLLAMVIVMSRMNLYLTLLSLALAPFLALAIRSFGARMRNRTTVAQQADSRVTSLVQESIGMLALIQAFTQEDAAARRFSAQTLEAQKRRLAQHGWELAYWFAIAVVFALGAASITWLGAAQVEAGHLTVGELLVFLAYLTQLFEPLNQLSHVGATVAGAMAGVRRVFEILDAPEEIKDRPDARPINSSAIGSVSFEQVSFAYEKGREVVREVSLTIKRGESVAVVGPSGAGKTTLLHLLARFFDPIGGAIKVDGVDLREIRLKDWRSQVALVLQEPILFSGTITENIGFGKPGATADEIETAARAAQAHEFIQKLAGGYNAVVGEGGARLSTGERQRIHLARAFLKNAPILLLDEPTSALDAESEDLIAESLKELMRGRLTLLVAHRPATIAVMQRAVLLREGKLIPCTLDEALQATHPGS